MAECDAQHLGQLLPRPANENADSAAASESAHMGVKGGAHSAAADLPSARADRAARANAGPRPRAKQSIPPALRRAILARDQRRCRVPGCKNATFLDVHHIQPRSEGGRNEPTNLVTLCGAHHRATHHGELSIESMRDGGARFRHADGIVYGHAVRPGAIDVQTKVFSALRQLGFREREVRAVLEELRNEADLRGATAEGLLREALRRIRPAPR
ncbi:MAG: HNH endonuclease, partial [Deltaproteobacteria bacterium]